MRTGLIALLAVSLLAAAYFVGSRLGAPVAQAESAKDPAGPSTVLYARGRIEPCGGIVDLSAPAHLGISTVSRLLVHEGQAVRRGEIVAYIDGYQALEAAAVEAAKRVEIARNRLELIREGPKRSEIQVREAGIRLALVELKVAQAALARAGHSHAAEPDLASLKLNVELNERRVEADRQALFALREVRPQDLNIASAAVQEAQAAMEQAREEAQTAIVRSPLDGRVLRVNTPEGARIGAAGIVSLADTSKMCAIAEIDERDRAHVHPGQAAEVQCDGIAAPFPGSVSRIALEVSRRDVLATDPIDPREARVVEAWVSIPRSVSLRDLTYLQADIRIHL